MGYESVIEKLQRDLLCENRENYLARERAEKAERAVKEAEEKLSDRLFLGKIFFRVVSEFVLGFKAEV